MKWITRHHVKVDRVACPWLIRRFIDPVAEFLFVAEDELLVTAIRRMQFLLMHLACLRSNSIIGETVVLSKRLSKITI